MAVDGFTSIKEAVDAIQVGVGSITGIAAAPSSPTEQAPDFPFVTTYPTAIDSMKIGPDPLFTTWWEITVEIHWNRQRLPVDMANALTTFPEAMLGKIAYIIQSNHTAFEKVTGIFGAMRWGDTETIGFQFKVIKLKIQTAVPTS